MRMSVQCCAAAARHSPHRSPYHTCLTTPSSVVQLPRSPHADITVTCCLICLTVDSSITCPLSMSSSRRFVDGDHVADDLVRLSDRPELLARNTHNRVPSSRRPGRAEMAPAAQYPSRVSRRRRRIPRPRSPRACASRAGARAAGPTQPAPNGRRVSGPSRAYTSRAHRGTSRPTKQPRPHTQHAASSSAVEHGARVRMQTAPRNLGAISVHWAQRSRTCDRRRPPPCLRAAR